MPGKSNQFIYIYIKYAEKLLVENGKTRRDIGVMMGSARLDSRGWGLGSPSSFSLPPYSRTLRDGSIAL